MNAIERDLEWRRRQEEEGLGTLPMIDDHYLGRIASELVADGDSALVPQVLDQMTPEGRVAWLHEETAAERLRELIANMTPEGKARTMAYLRDQAEEQERDNG